MISQENKLRLKDELARMAAMPIVGRFYVPL